MNQTCPLTNSVCCVSSPALQMISLCSSSLWNSGVIYICAILNSSVQLLRSKLQAPLNIQKKTWRLLFLSFLKYKKGNWHFWSLNLDSNVFYSVFTSAHKCFLLLFQFCVKKNNLGAWRCRLVQRLSPNESSALRINVCHKFLGKKKMSLHFQR